MKRILPLSRSILTSSVRLRNGATRSPRLLTNSVPCAASLSTATSRRSQGEVDSARRREIPQDGLTLSHFVSDTVSQRLSPSLASSSSSSSNNSSNASSANEATIKPHTFSIKTYGCQMNVSDTDVVRAVLLQAGYREAKREEDADIWLTNTCAIRDNAERKVWQRLRGLRKQKQVKLRAAMKAYKQRQRRGVESVVERVGSDAMGDHDDGVAVHVSYNNNNSHDSNYDNKDDAAYVVNKHDAPPKQVVGLLGCMAERLQDELFKDNLADLVVGPDAYRDIPRLLDDLLVDHALSTQIGANSSSNSNDNHNNDHDDDGDNDTGVSDRQDPIHQAINVQLSQEETYEDILPVRDPNTLQSGSAGSAFVSIQRGCSNRCAFCIVPFTRGGQERSRPYDSILDEVRHLVHDHNAREVVLLGQNVNSYHDRSDAAMLLRPNTPSPTVSNDGFQSRIRRSHHVGGYHFADLVAAVSDVSPELRVRFTSPHPKDYPTELLHLMAERPNVCNQLHLPAQSGSTAMLKRMKRGYSRGAYLELIDAVHAILPDVALSSDFIAGFCGETEQDHRDTVTLLEHVRYDQAFLFAYSMREKTHAHRTMQDDVPVAVKQRRLQELIDTFREQVHAKNVEHEVGRTRLVLVEGEAKRKSPQGDTNWHGRTDQNKRILFPVNASHAQYTSMRTHVRGHDGVDDGDDDDDDGVDDVVGDTGDLVQLVPGEYAAVKVTEAKGHTLRGELLWKTTLSDFAVFESS